ncbi:MULTISPECIES: hypothetical protein [Legionella]|uniref:Uncharacterized protein n=1 Tax=Legionella resiliens TaxID=2905958 RepID=A0ABS8X7M1_9GAMM|nr:MULTISPECIES: hypothetical protein [unclassified Legionella]MCE0724496.1 hypothetical protein [Legionella sp. 9fVS26]MCE3533649.1 hypothetical protein [Legionella sp. 8cVS16]QLZ69840.1 hypothetical protein FOLKNPGA_02640 [Legionella sp. PC1000]
MNKKIALIVAGLIFTLVALIHVLRIIYYWQVTVAGYSIPMSASSVALSVSAILAIWMFVAAAKK